MWIHQALAAAPTLTPNTSGGTAPNPNGVGAIIDNLTGSVVNVLFTIAGALAIFFVIYFGIQYITSNGNQDKTKSARQGLINAIIGVVIVIAAYAIIRFGVRIANTINSNV